MEGISPIDYLNHAKVFFEQSIRNKKNNYSSEKLQKLKCFNKTFNQLIALESFYDFLTQKNAPIALDLLVDFFMLQLTNYSTATKTQNIGLIFFSGWRGHTISCVIKKQKNARYLFYIWNTGDHMKDHHPSYFKGNKLLHSTGIYWNRLEFSQIANRNFIKRIFLCTINNYHPTRNIYNYATKHFAKAPQAADVRFSKQNPIQNFGTCVHNSCMAAFSCLLNDHLLMTQLTAGWTKYVREEFIKVIPSQKRTHLDRTLLKMVFTEEARRNKHYKLLQLVLCQNLILG